MALEVYYPLDIRNALLAAEQASGSALRAANTEDNFARGYKEGYHAALATIALAFGLMQWQEPEPARRPMFVFRAG